MFNQTQDGVKKAGQVNASSSQSFVRISEFRKNCMVMNDGTLRAVLKASSHNFFLKNEGEQDAIVYAYMSFLNSLEYPVQIFIRSRKLNLDKYLSNIATEAAKQQNILLKKQTYDYIEYVSQLLDGGDILKKDFYVIVPYGANITVKKVGFFNQIMSLISLGSGGDTLSKTKQDTSQFIEDRKQLMIRVSQVKSGLESCDIRLQLMSTSQLIELMYESYNPITAYNQKITNLDNMDFYRPESKDEDINSTN